MKKENVLLSIPFIGYALFLATVYFSTAIASFIFFITVLSTIAITLYLFNSDATEVKNVKED